MQDTSHVPTEKSVVDEVIFGMPSAPVEEAFAPQDTGTKPIEEVIAGTDIPPQGIPQPEQDAMSTPSNDEVRYQYWQSQSDKQKNRVDDLEKTNQMLQSQMNQLMETQATPNQAPVQEQEYQFPDAPEKPQKPRHFSREEAYSDGNSESARFQDDYDAWRDDMDEWRGLKHDYDSELLKQERENYQNEIKARQQHDEARRQESRQLDSLRSHLKKTYSAEDGQIENFINTMSKPDSLTIENLWKLYSLDNGQAQGARPNAQPTGPSPSFEQTQRAQQVPTSMGVVPSLNKQTSKGLEDRVMDELIGTFEKQNPW